MSDDALRANLIRLAYENPDMREHVLPLVKEAGRFVGSGTIEFHYQTRKGSTWFLQGTVLVPLMSGKNSPRDFASWNASLSSTFQQVEDAIHAMGEMLATRAHRMFDGVQIRYGGLSDNYVSVTGKSVVYRIEAELHSEGPVDEGAAEMVAATLSTLVPKKIKYKYTNNN